MFEAAELGRAVSRSEYDRRIPALRLALLRAQDELKQADFPVILVIGGVDGAGKGETVNLLHSWMDARFLQTHAFGSPSDEEAERPEFWRFWRVLPPKGRIGIFFGSWYTDPIVHLVRHHTKRSALEPALIRINHFEQELASDGALILKLWFHLSKEAQKHRLKSLEKDPLTRWRVTARDWRNFKLYDRFRKVSERVLRETSTGDAPWLIIEGADHRYRALTAGEHVLEALQTRLAERRTSERRSHRGRTTASEGRTVLDALDLSLTLGDQEYGVELEKLQGRLNRLSRKAKKKGHSTIAVFEGWDASGKGSAIRRLTAALDARDYSVIPIGAPSDEEKSYHYLWRFWRHLSRAGRFTIFDRSWYGRVLVERVEGFATEAQWKRAYAEINEFEEQLHQHGMTVVKYWLHVDRGEQLRRFKKRETVSFKQYKITREDFRNRKHWNAYLQAADEMIERTSTEFAPWILVEGNDKKFARIKILRTLCDAQTGL